MWSHKQSYSYYMPGTYGQQSYYDPSYGDFQFAGNQGLQFATPEWNPVYGNYPSAGSQGHSNVPYVASNARALTPAPSDTSGYSNTGRESASPSPQRTTRRSKRAASLKQKPNKAGKPLSGKPPKLSKPLSELTQDMAGVPVRDMHAWVNRSNEERMKEVEKRNGYITRPMNSFMLYRSAYAERTKKWCEQNNHQVVSAVSGESWPLEPESIRNHYEELARIERNNHAKAHPDYKFCPSKTGTPARKRKSSLSDNEEDDCGSAVEDGDEEWRPRADRRSKRKQRDEENANAFPSFNSAEYVHSPHSIVEQLTTAYQPTDMHPYYMQHQHGDSTTMNIPYHTRVPSSGLSAAPGNFDLSFFNDVADANGSSDKVFMNPDNVGDQRFDSGLISPNFSFSPQEMATGSVRSGEQMRDMQSPGLPFWEQSSHSVVGSTGELLSPTQYERWIQ